MSIHWQWLIAACALLLPPPFLSGALRRNILSSRRNSNLTIESLIQPWQNWFDLFRGALGTLILVELALVNDSTRPDGTRVVLACTAVVAAALLVQVIRLNLASERAEQCYQFIAPLFYLSGVTLFFGGFVTGAFAVAAGWMLGGASKNLNYILPAMGLALLGAGYVFGLGLFLIFNVALLLLPFAPAFVFRKRMVHVGSSAY